MNLNELEGVEGGGWRVVLEKEKGRKTFLEINKKILRKVGRFGEKMHTHPLFMWFFA